MRVRRPQLDERRVSIVHAAGWLASAALASYAVATSDLALRHNSDSLIPIFVSLESWTPFYWGQDRFGMLMPLLALPVRDGLWNLIVQNGLSVLILLLGTATLCGALGVRRPSGVALAVLAAIMPFSSHNLCLLLLTTNQSYSPALGMFGLATVALMRGGALPTLAGGVLMVVGAWTNAGVALLVVCLSAVLCVPRSTRTVAGRALIGAIVGICAHRVLQAWGSGLLVDVTRVRSVPVAAIPPALASLWLDLVQETGSSFLVLVGALWLVSLLSTMRRGGNNCDRAMLCAIGLGSVAYAIVMVTLFQGLGRHMSPVFVVALVAPLTVLHRAAAVGRRADAVIAIAALAVVAQTGVTTPRTLQRGLVAALGHGRADVVHAHGVRAVTGDYWEVWPLAFAANLIHEQATGERVVLPVALKADRLIAARAWELAADAPVLVVPSGDLYYWRSQVELPRLGSTVREFGAYSIAYVAADH